MIQMIQMIDERLQPFYLLPDGQDFGFIHTVTGQQLIILLMCWDFT